MYFKTPHRNGTTGLIIRGVLKACVSLGRHMFSLITLV
jgi:hypothetical protein